jgi:hypothetical protein
MHFASASYRSSAFFTAGAHVFLTVCIIACGSGSLQAEAHDLHMLSNGAQASHQHDSRHSHDGHHADNSEAACEHSLDSPSIINSIKNPVFIPDHLAVVKSAFGGTSSAVKPPTVLSFISANHSLVAYPLDIPLLI